MGGGGNGNNFLLIIIKIYKNLLIFRYSIINILIIKKIV